LGEAGAVVAYCQPAALRARKIRYCLLVRGDRNDYMALKLYFDTGAVPVAKQPIQLEKANST